MKWRSRRISGTPTSCGCMGTSTTRQAGHQNSHPIFPCISCRECVYLTHGPRLSRCSGISPFSRENLLIYQNLEYGRISHVWSTSLTSPSGEDLPDPGVRGQGGALPGAAEVRQVHREADGNVSTMRSIPHFNLHASCLTLETHAQCPLHTCVTRGVNSPC